MVLFSEPVFVGFILKLLERMGMLQKGRLLFSICRCGSAFIIRGWTVLGGEEEIGVTTFSLSFDVKPCRERL